MNTQQRAVVQQALKTLEKWDGVQTYYRDRVDCSEAITALRQLLDQPEQGHDHALEQALTRLQKRYAELEAKVGAQPERDDEPVAYSVGRTLHWHQGRGVNDAQLYARPQPAHQPDYEDHYRKLVERYDALQKELEAAKSQPEQPERWAVFCGGCRKEWSVAYQHPGKSICADCEAKLREKNGGAA